MTRLEKEPDSSIWLILVSDDAGFRHMLRSSKRSGFGVVVVNEFITKLSLEGDLRMPWLQLKAGSHSLDGLVDHIVGISTMGRSWMRENMNTNDFADEGVIVQIVLKLKNQSLANKSHETGAIVENNAETVLEQHLKHAGDRHLEYLENLEKALQKLEEPSKDKTMWNINGSILKLEARLKARLKARRTKKFNSRNNGYFRRRVSENFMLCRFR